MKQVSLGCLIGLLVACSLSIGVQRVAADGGTAVLKSVVVLPANMSVYEPGQKAIIAWNGRTERLVLSVDAHVSVEEATVLHFVPLPAKPTSAAPPGKNPRTAPRSMILALWLTKLGTVDHI